jgi:insertion element IS1 protein InsB
VIAAAYAPVKKPLGACEKYPISTRSNPACSWSRAVSAITSALKGGPGGGMISDDTRGAIHPIISTGILIPSHAESSHGIGHVWVGAYERPIDPEQHTIGKAHTQTLASKPMHVRTWIKRLVRRTMCFSKTTTLHDLVIGLCINRYEFGVAI